MERRLKRAYDLQLIYPLSILADVEKSMIMKIIMTDYSENVDDNDEDDHIKMTMTIMMMMTTMTVKMTRTTMI